ncbi:TetR/AcrR family transcriptional regulator [Leuconostoc gasicomitatum]|uniref:TetR/AcrR family transcriptional regulator n=1 Tax=Leuconostoc gasicomitatum TaxID=115778 RepID=UPI0007E1A4A4|nr:TetR/AcrR family transcriptional regulator [Leuconostoc gasicomitatum]CUW06940.1 Transcriptional regulator, TetR family [Leuconostoc gasicomitatum]
MSINKEDGEKFQTLFTENLNDDTALSDKQKAVLFASLTLFSQNGFDRTNTKDIALLAGVAEGTVYKQFKTKEGILKGILDPVIKTIVPKTINDFINSMVNTSYPSFEKFLYAIIKNRMTFIFDNLPQIKILLHEILTDQELLAEMTKNISESSANQFLVVLKHYQENGELVNWEPTRIIQYILAINVSYVLPTIINSQSKINLDSACLEATEFLLKGLTP